MSAGTSLIVLISIVMGSVFIGVGTNAAVGVGVFFLIYALVGAIDG